MHVYGLRACQRLPQHQPSRHALSARKAPRISALTQPTTGVCAHTAAVRTTILCKLPGRNTCAQVAAADLRGITGALNLFRMRRTALNAWDFRGLTGLDALWLNHNSLATRPADLFDVLTNLCGFYLANSPGSSFTFTATVAQTAPTLVKVAVAQAAPFDMTVTLSATGGTLSPSSTTVAAGSSEGSCIAVAPASMRRSRSGSPPPASPPPASRTAAFGLAWAPRTKRRRPTRAPSFEALQSGANDDSNTYTLTVTNGTGDRALTTTQDLTVTNVYETPPPPPPKRIPPRRRWCRPCPAGRGIRDGTNPTIGARRSLDRTWSIGRRAGTCGTAVSPRAAASP